MKDLIILAKGNSRLACPFDADEVWGVNDVGSFPEFRNKKITRCFTFDPRDEKFLKECRENGEIWSWQPYADKKYPLEEVINKFGTKYFTNTLSYMFALALYEGWERVRTYGVDAPYGGIYFMEKSGLEYWIGRLQQAGVQVDTHDCAGILKTHDNLLYGQRGECSIDLFLSERMYLMNLLPKEGDYDNVYRANLIRWLLALKVKEKEAHNVQVGASPNGTTIYQMSPEVKLELDSMSDIFKKVGVNFPAEISQKIAKEVEIKNQKHNRFGEFVATIHFPYWTVEYLRDLLKNLERQGKLPVYAVAVYEKFAKFKQPESIYEYKKKVSYVLATKNRAKFLEKTLENCKKLLTEKDELIIVDGNSTDGTKEVLESYKSIINKVITGEDKNAAHALNKGFLSSIGTYVKQLPDDDIIFPDEMQRAITYLDEHPEIDLLVCGGIKRDGSGDKLIQSPENYGHEIDDVFKYGACGAGFIFRRDSLSKYGLWDTSYVDIDQEIACRIISMGGVVKFFPSKHYFHQIYPHSTSIQGLERWKQDNVNLIKKYSKNPGMYGVKC